MYYRHFCICHKKHFIAVWMVYFFDSGIDFFIIMNFRCAHFTLMCLFSIWMETNILGWEEMENREREREKRTGSKWIQFQFVWRNVAWCFSASFSSSSSSHLRCGCGVYVLQTCNWHICAILLTNIFSDGIAMNYWLSWKSMLLLSRGIQ